MRRALFLAGLIVIAVLAMGGSAYAAMGTEPITYYVNDDAVGANTGTSWQDAFTDLQSALNAAVSGDEIWVAEGTYKPSLTDRTASFDLKSGVAMYGGFSGDETARGERSVDTTLTVLSGDIGIVGSDSDNSYHVVYADGVTGAVLDGFTVTLGRAVSSYPGESQGAGICTSNSVLTVANCVFTDNRTAGAYHRGGGMCNIDSAATVTGCTFSANVAGSVTTPYSDGSGAGMYNSGWYVATDGSRISPVVTGCTFEDNVTLLATSGATDGGAGMCNEDCEPTVTNCIFARNHAARYGGAIFNVRSTPTITNCVFTGNWARDWGGAVANVGGRGNFINDTFYRNGWDPRVYPSGEARRPFTYRGGAIYEVRAVVSTIVDCLFSENAVFGFAEGGGAYRCDDMRSGTSSGFYNCLFDGNVSWNFDNWPASNIVIDSFPAPPQTDLLYDLDPLFVDPANGDFHLLPDSPCIDAGVTQRFAEWNWWPFPPIDFEDANRAVDGDGEGVRQADIGADEYLPTLLELRDLLVKLESDGLIDSTLAADLLVHVADSQAALEQGDELAAISALRALIADAQAALGDSGTEKTIASKATAVLYTEDTHAPIVTAPADPTPVEATDWDGASVTFDAATATDNVDGTVAASSINYYIDYHTGGQLEVQSGDTFEIGATTVTAAATDSCGNVGAATFTVTVQDTKPPVTTSNTPSGWQKGDVTVNFTATDPSGVSHTYFTLDGGAQVEGDSVIVSGDGIHALTFWSVDTLGHTETAHATAVKIDATAPVTTTSDLQSDRTTGWLKPSKQVTLTAGDFGNLGILTSGVAATYYSVDNVAGGAPQTYSGPFTVTGDGSHAVSYWSVDDSGNTESVHTGYVNIDTEAPATTVANYAEQWINVPITLQFAPTDLESGVASTQYSTNNRNWVTGTSYTVATAGRTTVYFRSTDKLGNAEATQSIVVKIDRAAPTITITTPKSKTVYRRGTAVTALWKAVDNTSGIASASGTLPSGSVIDTSTPGNYVFTVTATDRAGNTATTSVSYSVK